MAKKTLRLRALTRAERRVLANKLKDLSLSARLHQRYRITDEWVRRLLRREGLSAQRIRTWKTSHDPHFDRKKNASARSTRDGQRGQP